MRMKRCWINAPSTFDPYHNLHGENVLVSVSELRNELPTVYFVRGPVVSQLVPRSSLRPGWNLNDKEN